jgi:hypothetical protein
MHKILSGVIVEPLMEQINEHPELWDQNTLRTSFYPNSPHREVSDIWLRYRSMDEFDIEHPEDFASEHKSVWYPAEVALSCAWSLIEPICRIVDAEELGGVLITKIPPGKQVYPHNDAGPWHPEYYASKYLLLLQSAPGQVFSFEGEQHEGETGDLFIFDNRHPHWVVNKSDVDRVSLILAIKQKQPELKPSRIITRQKALSV